MRFIIDGKHNSRKRFNPWLQDILELVKTGCRRDIDITVESVNRNSTLVYRLDNARSKAHAILEKHKHQVNLLIYQRKLPNPEKSIVPDLQLIVDVTADISLDTSIMLSELLIGHLCVKTRYWNKEYSRIKVADAPDCGSVFYGGRIDRLTEKGKIVTLHLNSGHDYNFNHTAHLLESTMIGKYVVITQYGIYELISPQDYEAYFDQYTSPQ